jgi:hypothetical protein
MWSVLRIFLGEIGRSRFCKLTVNKSKMKCPYAPHYYPLKEKQEPGYTLPNNNVPDKIEAEAWRLTVLQVVESLIKLSKV